MFIRSNKHKFSDIQFSNQTSVSFAMPIRDDVSLIKGAMIGLEQIYRKDINYSKTGIMVLNLVPLNKDSQLDLFSTIDERSFLDP